MLETSVNQRESDDFDCDDGGSDSVFRTGWITGDSSEELCGEVDGGEDEDEAENAEDEEGEDKEEEGE